MKKLFGTDGIRGEAGKFPLNEETIRTVGKSLARQFNQKRNGHPTKFIIGRDTRESGNWIEKAFIEGAFSEGAECVSAGVITTPGVAFLTQSEQASAGVVISASHNPFQDNGIKIFSPTGKKIDEAAERQIEADIANQTVESNNINSSINFSETENTKTALKERYLAYLAGEFAGLSLQGLKMAIDCANGAASELAPNLFKRLGAEVVAIHNQPDGRNINENCGSTHINELQAKAKEIKADFGVAFDGDADRALFVDANGNLVDGDATLWVMANHLKSHGELLNNTVVATVMSNLGLEIALKSKGFNLLRTAVGDKYVLEELLKTDSCLGGEQSGHIIFPRRSLVGDGMLTTLYMLQAMQETKSALHDLTAGFRQFPQTLKNVKVREKLPFEQFIEIAETAGEVENELGDTGRLLLRYSGTENLARVMIEGQDQAEIEMLANRLIDVIQKSLGV
jgi:phosphoglucosamine mutase